MAGSLGCKWPSQGGGKLGANQYLPGATKKAGGKGHTGYVYGGGGHRRFYWATLTLVWTNPGSEWIKAGAQPPWFGHFWKTRNLREQTGGGDVHSALSLGLSLQAETGGRSKPGCSPVCLVWESSTLPNPDVPMECTHFHFERKSPFWASEQLTTSTVSEVEVYDPKGTDRTPESLTKMWWPLGSSSINTLRAHFPGTEGKRLLELVHGQRRARHPLCRLQTVLFPSPTWGR